MKVHHSLRPYVGTPDELYRLLQQLQARTLSMIGFRVLLMVALLAAGMVIPGPWGSLALCLAPVAGVACLFAIGDHVARDWFMHALTLHELIRPRYQSADELFADWIKPEEQQVQ